MNYLSLSSISSQSHQFHASPNDGLKEHRKTGPTMELLVGNNPAELLTNTFETTITAQDVVAVHRESSTFPLNESGNLILARLVYV